MAEPRESQHLDRESLRLVTGAKADFGQLAQSCVASPTRREARSTSASKMRRRG